MKILLTGQSGLNKRGFLEEVKQIIDGKSTIFCFETVGKKMIKKCGNHINEQNILNLPKSQLDVLRAFACESILKELQTKECDFFVLNTHAVFRWQHGLFPS